MDNDDVYDMAGTAIAFMSIMATLGRTAEAATIEGHLDAAGLLRIGILHRITVEATDRIAAAESEDLATQRELGRSLQGRDALHFMRRVLVDALTSPT